MTCQHQHVTLDALLILGAAATEPAEYGEPVVICLDCGDYLTAAPVEETVFEDIPF